MTERVHWIRPREGPSGGSMLGIGARAARCRSPRPGTRTMATSGASRFSTRGDNRHAAGLKWAPATLPRPRLRVGPAVDQVQRTHPGLMTLSLKRQTLTAQKRI